MKAILTYHSVDDSGSPISVGTEAFARHHAWLTSSDVQVLSLEALVAHPAEGADAVAVTFDDAFLNTREPIARLRADGVPVTVFVVSGRVGETNAWGGRDQPGIPTLPLMGWDDLEHLAASGAQLASHTRTHRPLTVASAAEQDDELHGSQSDIEARLGIRVDAICYPYGDVDASVTARAAGSYRHGCTTVFEWLSTGADPLALPRLDMYYFRAAGHLEAWGSSAFARRVRWCQLRRAIRARLLGGAAPRVGGGTEAPSA